MDSRRIFQRCRIRYGPQPGRDGQQGDAVDLPGAAVHPAFDEAQALEQLVG